MENDCNLNRKWYLFVAVDLAIYFGGLLLILCWLLFKSICCQRRNQNSHSLSENEITTGYTAQLEKEGLANDYACFVAIRLYIGELLSTQCIMGKLILLISTLASILSVGLYLYEVMGITFVLENCNPLGNWIYCVDLGCNTVFLLHFLLRFVSSTKKIRFWISIFTIVDIFTISQILVSLYLSREWVGLRFLRVVSLTSVPLVMQNFKIIKSVTSIRILSLMSLFLCIWIGGAGFIHLFENSGQLVFTRDYKSPHNLSLSDCLYYIIVTLSTVGYGDITPATISGRVFITFFILFALAVFASFIPELTEFIFSQSSYSGTYHKENGRRHVIVCGHINFNSASTFLADFFHEDRSNKNVEVVFLNKDEPQDDLKALLKSYLQVKYFQGTVLNHHDLDRAQMGGADACLILANQNCLHPNEEDAGNTMRAISLKNYQPACPVIIQLLQFENKIYLENIPAWNRRNGDQIICYSEIELGILAQSCLVPGFSTLLTNLFSVRAAEGCQHLSEKSRWLKNYMSGTTLEIYSAKLSSSLRSMTYKELVGFCSKKLNLLLVAIEIVDSENKKSLLINPLNCQKIYCNTIGYFICDSYKDAKIASLFCTKCHSNVNNLKHLKKCKCENVEGRDVAKIVCQEANNNTNIDDEITKEHNQIYRCNFQNLSDCLIENLSQTNHLNNHIILCIFSEKDSPLIGLRNFIYPLRSTTIPENELKDLLIVADKDFIEKEWLEISLFPRIKVVFQSFSIRRMTELLVIERCSRCVMLNAKSNFSDLQNDLYMVDKEIIIANLYFQSRFHRNLQRQYTPSKSQEPFKELQSATVVNTNDKRTVLIQMDSPCSKQCDFTVPIISKLAIESNVQFLDVKETNTSKIPNYLRKPFAFGYVFTANMLDSLLSTAYFSPNAISIMEILITGGLNCQIQSEDEKENKSSRIRIELLSVAEFNCGEYYIDLFVEALNNHDCLCLGLYRKRHLVNDFDNFTKIDRYVITNPSSIFRLDSSDMVYCLKQI